MKKSIQLVKDNLLLIVLVMQPFLDILAYIQRDFSISAAGYIRLALTVCLPLYTLVFTKRKKQFIGVMAIIGVFCALHILNTLREGFSGAFSDTKYMLLVAHAPILLFSFLFLYDKESIKKQITISLIISAIVSVLVFYLSYALNSGNCTYPLFQMGWTGWYVIPNAQSLILVSLLPFAVYYAIKYCKYYFPLIAAPIVYMYTINGTKAAFLALLVVFAGVAGFTVLELIFTKRDKFQVYKVVMASVLIVVSLLCYNYSPRQIIDSTAESNRQQEQQVLEELMNSELDEDGENQDGEELKGKAIYLKYINPNLVDRFGGEKVLEAYGKNLNSYGMSDMRLKKLIFGRLTWEESDFATQLVGFEFSKMQHNGDNFDLENDPQAILYYYGYIGAALYLAFIGYFVLRMIKQLILNFKDSFNLFNFMILIALMLQIFGALYSGYLLRRPNVAIYLTVVLLLIHCRTEPLFRKKKRECAPSLAE